MRARSGVSKWAVAVVGTVFLSCVPLPVKQGDARGDVLAAGQCNGVGQTLIYASEIQQGARFRRLEIGRRCGADRYTLSLVGQEGGPTVLATVPLEEGARVSGRFISGPSDSTGVRAEWIVVVFGFEPASDDRVFRVDVFSVSPFRKQFQAWSYQAPTFDDVDGDGREELVVYRDLFLVERPDAQVWPYVFKIGSLVEPVDLRAAAPLLARVRLKTAASLQRVQDTCSALMMDPCPLSDSARALRNQLATLTALTGG